MKKLVLLPFLLVVGLGVYGLGPPEKGPEERVTQNKGLQPLFACSVCVTSGSSGGSGVAFRNGDRTFVWTNAHVVQNAKQETRVETAPGQFVVTVRYALVKVGRPSKFDDRGLRELTMYDARLVRLSEKEDLALLEVIPKVNLGSVRFAKRRHPSELGDDLWHIGSPGGPNGTWSLFKHQLSSIGRDTENGICDMTGGPFYPGCSGGGFFTMKGECVGLMHRYLYNGSHCIGMFIPSRRVREFAQKSSALWALDSSVPVPEKDDRPVESDK